MATGGGGLTFSPNDFLNASFVAFEDMRKRGHLCDLTIKVQNSTFSVHRVILSAGIPYFDSMFGGLETTEKEFTVVEDLDPKALEALIHFAYTGKVDISPENVLSLLGAAQFLQLRQVQNACLRFLSKKLNSDNVVKVSTLACALNNLEVIESSNSYIQENFEEFSKRDEFLNLPFECLKTILSADDLNVSSEEIVFEVLMQWVKVSPSERKGKLPELLGEIRLTRLSVEYLMETVESEELIMSSKECRNLVKEIKYYHMMPERTPAVSNLKTHPRNFLKKELYAVCDCSICGSSVHRYDSDKGKWCIVSLTEMSFRASKCPRWNNIVAVNEKIYIFLGDGAEIFNLKTHEWEKLKIAQNVFREGAALEPYENAVYCFGSSIQGGTKSVRRFDTHTNQCKTVKFMEMPRAYGAAATLGNAIYVTGGIYNIQDSNGSNSVGKYIPSTDAWSDVAPMLIKRSHHCCTSMNGKIYVCGNYKESIDEARMEVYDPFTNQWNFLPFVYSESVYKCISLVSDHDKIYAFTDGSGEIHNPRTHQWMSLKTPRSLMRVVSLSVIATK